MNNDLKRRKSSSTFFTLVCLWPHVSSPVRSVAVSSQQSSLMTFVSSQPKNLFKSVWWELTRLPDQSDLPSALEANSLQHSNSEAVRRQANLAHIKAFTSLIISISRWHVMFYIQVWLVNNLQSSEQHLTLTIEKNGLSQTGSVAIEPKHIVFEYSLSSFLWPIKYFRVFSCVNCICLSVNIHFCICTFPCAYRGVCVGGFKSARHKLLALILL